MWNKRKETKKGLVAQIKDRFISAIYGAAIGGGSSLLVLGLITLGIWIFINDWSLTFLFLKLTFWLSLVLIVIFGVWGFTIGGDR